MKTVELEKAIEAIKSHRGDFSVSGKCIDNMVQSLNQLPDASQWIDVKTPPKDANWKRVLIDGRHDILPWHFDGHSWWCYGSSIADEKNVTHWQDIPQYPIK